MTTTAKKETEEHLRGIVQNLPETPGCYQYLDERGTIIYVGKAKNLKRRVSSYFNKDQTNLKTRILVGKIRDIRYVVVRTEQEALLLENNLIKRHQPRYNVLLKDGKTYPSIAVTKEFLPRIFQTRNRTLKGATFFGPYSHIPTLHALLDLCRQLYHPRPCRMPLTEEGLAEGKYRVCLEYHIKRCEGPCEGLQRRQDYLENIENCKEILRGHTAALSRRLKERMIALAEEMKFEEAQKIKEKYVLIEQYRAKSEVVTGISGEIDVFNIESEETKAYINFLHVTEGAIVQAFTFEYTKKLDETDEELLTLGVVEMRSKYESRAPELILPFTLDLPESFALQTVPQRGERKKLLELSKLNVKQYRFDRLKQAEKLNPEQKQTRMMGEIRDLLNLPGLPVRIEMFDNSNLQGTDAVAACVVFEKLRPAKKEYRKYTIKTVEGADDYASMREVARRRYSRAVEEGTPLPNLLIADGGAGQMEALRGVIHDGLGLEIPIAGLAKDERHRTRALLYGNPPQTIGMKPDSPLFRLLTKLQDEVHRFAIAFHRDKRSKRQTASALDGIAGVGEKTKALLLRHFGSFKRVKEAAESDLQSLLGEKRGSKVFAALRAKEGRA